MVTTMKKKINFFDRPPSADSGTPLGKRVVVQHRCDILMEEQVCVIAAAAICFSPIIT